MTKEETKIILQKVKVAYPNAYSRMDNTEKIALWKEWSRSLRAYRLSDVEKAIEEHISISPYPPTIARIIIMVKGYAKQHEQSLSEQWRDARKCIKCNDTGFVSVPQQGTIAEITYFCDCELGKLKAGKQMEDHRERGINWRTRSISELEVSDGENQFKKKR